jgi:predicted  nucleic acid-binding Zn-ribbon protein
MSNDDEIAYLTTQLEKDKQELEALQKDPSSPAWKINRLRTTINQHEIELQALRQPAGSSSHAMTIDGNAQVGVAVSGNVHGPISQQSAPTTHFNAPVHAGSLSTGQQAIERMDITMGDTKNTNISGITNSVVGVESTFSNVQVQIGSLPAATPDKQELERLVTELQQLLKQAEAQGKQAEAQTAATRVEAAVGELTKPKPDKELIQFNLGSLKTAAENIAGVLPTILPIALQIVSKIQGLLPG